MTKLAKARRWIRSPDPSSCLCHYYNSLRRDVHSIFTERHNGCVAWHWRPDICLPPLMSDATPARPDHLPPPLSDASLDFWFSCHMTVSTLGFDTGAHFYLSCKLKVRQNRAFCVLVVLILGQTFTFTSDQPTNQSNTSLLLFWNSDADTDIK